MTETAANAPVWQAEAQDKAKAEAVQAAGYGAAGGRFRAMATSGGLFAYDRQSHADFTVTARRADGSWSGWAGASDYRFGALDTGETGLRAVAKAAHDAAPLDLDPGQYTVILEPSAVGELLHAFFWSLDAREADEGRNWLAGKDGAKGDQGLPGITNVPAGYRVPNGPGDDVYVKVCNPGLSTSVGSASFAWSLVG